MYARVAVSRGANLEARARVARYDALERARVAHGATTVLVAHTPTTRPRPYC